MFKIITLTFASLFVLITNAYAQSSELPDTVWTKFTYPNKINAVKFTPDGKYLVSGGDDGVPRLWDAETGVLVREYIGNISKIWSMDINNNGDIIATVNDSSLITIWNLQTGEIVRKLQYYEDINSSSNGRCISFSNNGKYLAAIISKSGQISIEFDLVLFDTEEWKVISKIQSIKVPFHVTFNSDDTKIAVSNVKTNQDELSVVVYDIPNLNIFKVLGEGNKFGIFQTAFSPDGKYLAGAIENSPNKIWNTDDWSLFREFGDDGSDSRAIAFSKDSKYIVMGAGYFSNLKTNIYNVETKELIYSYNNRYLFENSDIANTIDISLNQELIAVGGAFGIYMLNAKWNTTDIKDSIEEIEPAIYPNPTTGIVNIPFNSMNAGKYEIFNTSGTLIDAVMLKDQANEMITIDFTQYPAGMYYVKVHCGETTEQYKVVRVE